MAVTDVLMAVAGGLGAVARFELASLVARLADRRFPLGTLTVNTVGALLTGVAVASGPGVEVDRVLVTGFLGGFTTFSTWMVETARLAEDGPGWRDVAVNIVAMLVLGLAGAGIGLAVA